ncbi:hydroxyacylglutathione hydrolase [Candidatus Pseudomonas adelgestsugas]|uniref:Hydroxyacylglutathione hydrolase n=1 Tax=Candidatus Pseudomonas adelgestsugas TaxID=1302376 RepID=A0ABX5R9F0_9PSED|nr:hydroxyacylglutathione hydrolase [Candidatus Pseudomonas adelgestsugas]QAX81825.1 Hydroxyacylglutathione hydrolase [Candidatus Pseudomonas adelgestsugas]
MIQISALPAFTDNYLWLLKNLKTKHCAVVDPGVASPVLAWLAQNPAWMLRDILITHYHYDHVGGVEQLKIITGAKVYCPANEKIPTWDVAIQNNDRISILGWDFDIYSLPGHTLGHIAYYHQGVLFCGDTLFAAGCGRLLEGTPEQMYSSLQRLATLPANTLVYCAHEYTQSNLKFAQAVEPDNADIAERVTNVKKLLARGKVTLPSNLALEKRTNPFLRTAEISVKQKADEWSSFNNRFGVEVFTSLRAWKDKF